ncbi:hypothetical protein [Siphonobacter aquaeclarae]|uniref:DUF937 domain-containing protein n=1 Tax=Siphonobacter aquaeclarae TaxID=563176 RepID=A0A1G9S2B9_9BACT|nr:hypothetical protein [Siphonobacter aquaeclarae]SDM29562.1 hypothetical protein SAMN04488090_3146 [Siphonobacter aquaeclarae]
MLEQLLGLIKDNSQEAIVNNPAIPNQYNDSAQATILSSIANGLKNEAEGGNLGGLIGLLTGKQAQGAAGVMGNPVVSGIAQNAIEGLMEKFGIENQAAKGIVASVLPSVIGGLISKIGDNGDSSIDLNSAMGSILSNTQTPQQTQGFDFNQIGAALSDGKIDMNDVMNIGGSLLGGNSGGGLGGLLGGLFGGNK